MKDRHNKHIWPIAGISLAAGILLLSGGPLASAQTDASGISGSAVGSMITVSPLFTYPVAPEELPDLGSKSEYLLKCFWDSLDFSRQSTVDQNALNDAFQVYAATLPYASRNVAFSSINSLIKKLKGNPVLLLQFTKAAEESLYGPRASIWSDEAYLPFLRAIAANKKIPEPRKARYGRQLSVLEKNAVGERIPQVRLTLRDGRRVDYKPERRYTLIRFGAPDCPDCRFVNTKLSMASDLQELVEAGVLDILLITADARPEEQETLLEQFKGYPREWIPAICYGGNEIFDIRALPSFYLLGPKGEIIGKNLEVSDAIDRLRDLLEAESKNTEK